MKYMLIMRATDEAYESFQDVDFDKILDTMGRFNDEMISAGVLVAAEGLDDASQGVVVDYSSEPPVVTDGRPSVAAPNRRAASEPILDRCSRSPVNGHVGRRGVSGRDARMRPSFRESVNGG